MTRPVWEFLSGTQKTPRITRMNANFRGENESQRPIYSSPSGRMSSSMISFVFIRVHSRAAELFRSRSTRAGQRPALLAGRKPSGSAFRRTRWQSAEFGRKIWGRRFGGTPNRGDRSGIFLPAIFLPIVPARGRIPTRGCLWRGEQPRDLGCYE